MNETSTQWPLITRIERVHPPADPSKPVIAHLRDASGRTYTLMLSSTAAISFCAMLSHCSPAWDVRVDAFRTARFRLDDFVPIIELMVEPRNADDRAKVVSALAARVADGAQIRFEDDAASGKVKLAGIDEQQLDQIVGGLRAAVGDFGIGPVQIAYREAITQRGTVDYTHKKVRDGGGEFARVKLVLEPVPYKDGVTFMGVRARANLSEDYIGAVEHGVRSVLASGALAGVPVIGVRALLVDGAFHDADSSPLAFELAARAATKELLRACAPVMLDPIVRIDVVAPEVHVPAILEDLKTRRGFADGRGRRSPDGICITANAPAANLFGYAASLRSITGGRARFTSQFESYAPVPRPDDPSFRPALGMRA